MFVRLLCPRLCIFMRERVVSNFVPAMMDDHAGRHPTTHEKTDGSIVICSALFSRKSAGHVYRVQLTALSAF